MVSLLILLTVAMLSILGETGLRLLCVLLFLTDVTLAIVNPREDARELNVREQQLPQQMGEIGERNIVVESWITK